MHDDLPLFNVRPDPTSLTIFLLPRFYPQLRMYGADIAVPTSVVTLKAEAAYFASSDIRSDEYLIYVLQLERQVGEWNFSGGYVGEVVTQSRNALKFSP